MIQLYNFQRKLLTRHYDRDTVQYPFSLQSFHVCSMYIILYIYTCVCVCVGVREWRFCLFPSLSFLHEGKCFLLLHFNLVKRKIKQNLLRSIYYTYTWYYIPGICYKVLKIKSGNIGVSSHHLPAR